MKDKAFFQLVALVTLTVTLVFLFTEHLDREGLVKVGISGALFVVATLLALMTGRSGIDE